MSATYNIGYLRCFLLTVFFCIAAPACIVAFTDPYQVWHDPWFRADGFSTNQRYQNAGLIRRFLECADCKPAAVVVGTSLSENMSLTDLREVTGLDNAVRLLARGSRPVEHWHMLSRALASGNVEVVYWEVYRNFVHDDFDSLPNPATFPKYLYTRSILDDLRYLFSSSNVRTGLELLGGREDWVADPDSLNSWHGEALEQQQYQRWNDPWMIETITDRVAPRIAEWAGTEPDWNARVPVYERHILPLVDAYPEVRFVFYWPPVSLIRHGEDIATSFSAQLALRLRLAQLAAERPNVVAFMFDDYEPLVTDMAFYKDPGHYTAGVDRWMLQRMQAGDDRFLLQPAGARERLQNLWEAVIAHVPYSSCARMPQTCGELRID